MNSACASCTWMLWLEGFRVVTPPHWPTVSHPGQASAYALPIAAIASATLYNKRQRAALCTSAKSDHLLPVQYASAHNSSGCLGVVQLPAVGPSACWAIFVQQASWQVHLLRDSCSVHQSRSRCATTASSPRTCGGSGKDGGCS
jgi:hypothetical protein